MSLGGSPMPRVDGVLETALYVDDPERSTRFYQAVFGFELWYAIRPEVTAELRQIIVDELLKKK